MAVTREKKVLSQNKTNFPIRAVHLDLKGTPPTPSRLCELPRMYAAAGYNSILVEWEDMFCWSVDKRFRNETAYSVDDIKNFCLSAQQYNIEIIPLVQCLGHMENPLSIDDYAHLRELPHRSDVLNPLADGAADFVWNMVEDVLKHIGTIKYFHLGGDEAWSFGKNPQTKAYIAQYGKDKLYMHHVEPLLDKLNDKNIRPILWHDMMCDWNCETLRDFGKKADLMVWCYGQPHMTMSQLRQSGVIEKFKNCDITMWGATAYKGADYESNDLPDIENRLENAVDWLEIAKSFDFAGIVATAWSRFSSHRVQNEPMDAALDSLFLIGAILKNEKTSYDDIVAEIERIGEKERFTCCKLAMIELNRGRLLAWQNVSHLREQIAMSTIDNCRRGSGVCFDIMKSLEYNLTILEQTALSVNEAFAGLVDSIWIQRYLAERITPLYNELEILEQNVRQLEPQVFDAESNCRYKTVHRRCC